MVSEAQKRARNKYDAKHYTIVGCKIRKEYAAEFKAATAAAGTSQGAVLRRAIDEFMSRVGSAAGEDIHI